jgi:AcrR family transcriptional regulator
MKAKRPPRKALASRRANASARGTPGIRGPKKEATKQRILTVALELFKKHGLHGTTTKRISQRAGIAEGTLFNYFKTKEDVAIYFFQQKLEHLEAWYRGEKRLRGAPLPEKLFAIIHRQLEDVAESQNFIGEVLFRALEPRSKLSPLSLESQELRVRYLKFIREVLDESAAQEEIPPVGDLGAHVVGLFYIGTVAHWLGDASPGKQRSLALLDRGLQFAMRFIQRGGWEW